MRKSKRIITPYGAQTKIAKEIGCSVSTVKNALRGTYDSPLSIQIRTLATSKKYGGKAM